MAKIVKAASSEELKGFLLSYNHGLFSDIPELMQKERENIGESAIKNNSLISLEANKKINGLVIFNKLNWDTEFFGMPCAAIDFLHGSHNGLLLKKYLDWSKGEHIRFAYSKVPLLDTDALNSLKKAGFEVIEDVASFRHALQGVEKNKYKIRSWKKEDLPYLEEASVSSTFDRFHTDKRFDDAVVEKYRRTWIRNLCNGLADVVLVVELEGVAAGFIACNINKKMNIGIIKLIAVHPDFRRRGCGSELVNASLNWFKGKVKYVYVSTQKDNIPSIGMYLKCGFEEAPALLTMHRWS